MAGAPASGLARQARPALSCVDTTRPPHHSLVSIMSVWAEIWSSVRGRYFSDQGTSPPRAVILAVWSRRGNTAGGSWDNESSRFKRHQFQVIVVQRGLRSCVVMGDLGCQPAEMFWPARTLCLPRRPPISGTLLSNGPCSLAPLAMPAIPNSTRRHAGQPPTQCAAPTWHQQDSLTLPLPGWTTCWLHSRAAHSTAAAAPASSVRWHRHTGWRHRCPPPRPLRQPVASRRRSRRQPRTSPASLLQNPLPRAMLSARRTWRCASSAALSAAPMGVCHAGAVQPAVVCIGSPADWTCHLCRQSPVGVGEALVMQD